MMERRAFFLSTGISVLAMYLMYQYVTNQEAELQALYGLPYQKMVIAKRAILQYETIRPTDVEEILVPNAMVPPGMITSVSDVVDAVAAVPIMQKEQILDSKIISKNVYSGLDTNIAAGRRAISVRVTPKSSVGYQIRPGNRVDLAAHFNVKMGGTAISEVKVFMQDLLVLAIGKTVQISGPKGVDQGLIREITLEQKARLSQENPSVRETLEFVKTEQFYQTVTLEVTPEQAQKLFYVVETYGDSLSVLLRNSNDRTLDARGTTNFVAIMGDDSWYVRRNKIPAQPRAVPRIKFFDYLGNIPRAVTEDR